MHDGLNSFYFSETDMISLICDDLIFCKNNPIISNSFSDIMHTDLQIQEVRHFETELSSKPSEFVHAESLCSKISDIVKKIQN